MHPILGRRGRLAVYLAAWAPIAALLALPLALQAPWWAAGVHGAFSAYLAALVLLSSYYLCKAIPLKATPPWALLLIWLTASASVGVLWRFAVKISEWLLLGLVRGSGPALPGVDRGLVIHVGPLQGEGLGAVIAVFYLVMVLINYLLIEHDRLREVERLEQESRVLAREAELKALRAQLNPHFLFNSLNSISALTSIDPKRARQMCVLLSDFLRKSLKLGERSSVSLAEEVDLVRNYLAIEQIRFGDRLQVALEVDPAVQGAPVPPLLLQPLVENAIKHGISQVAEGGLLNLRAARLEGFVEVLVDNPVDPESEPPVGLGIGLRQVRQRLQGRFQARTRFEAGILGDRHRVVLVFPMDDPEEAPAGSPAKGGEDE